MAARLAFFIDSGEMLERQSDVSQAPPWPYWPPNMPVTAHPSATPEGGGRRELESAEEFVETYIADQGLSYGPDFRYWLKEAIEADRAARDALHAETLRREVQAQATSDAGSFAAERAELQRLVADALAALQHGEERERVMREALEVLADRPAAMTVYGPKCTLCYIHGGGHDSACPVRAATDALATAQAMKEGT